VELEGGGANDAEPCAEPDAQPAALRLLVLRRLAQSLELKGRSEGEPQYQLIYRGGKMLKGGQEEYRLAREEMMSLKDCITTYMGFTLGSAGVVAVCLTILSRALPQDPLWIGLSCLVISILITCVASVLFYKFTSHNRVAGYCKLLTHEIADDDVSQEVEALYSWEIVIERLKLSDYNREVIISMLGTPPKIQIKGLHMDGIKQLDRVIRLFTGRRPPSDNARYFWGWWAILKALVGKIQSRSWGFPPIPAAILFTLTASFLFIGTVIIYTQSAKPDSNAITTIALDAAKCIVSLQILVWTLFAGKLHSVCEGSSTVQGYFWRYLPARAQYLNSQGIEPKYFQIESMLDETLEHYRRVRQE